MQVLMDKSGLVWVRWLRAVCGRIMGAGNVVSVGEMGGGRQEGESSSRPPPVPYIGADRLTSLLNVFDVPEPSSVPRTSKWPKAGDPPARLPARASREASCPLTGALEDPV